MGTDVQNYIKLNYDSVWIKRRLGQSPIKASQPMSSSILKEVTVIEIILVEW